MSEVAASLEADSGANTTADHIKELLRIDQDVTKILKTASMAISDLTSTVNGSSAKTESINVADRVTPPTIEASKQAFEEHTSTYFSLIQSLSERLHRQVNALEKAGIIAAESHPTEAQPQTSQQSLPTRPGQTPAKVEAPMQITNGGLGNLDVGWLNSRRDVVGKQKETELWAEARKHLDSMLKTGNEDEDQKGMKVD